MLDRDIITNTLNGYLGDVLEDKLFDYMEEHTNIGCFILNYHNETALIYNTYNDKYISWYKLTHIGRDFHTNIMDIGDFDRFCLMLKEELLAYGLRKNV